MQRIAHVKGEKDYCPIRGKMDFRVSGVDSDKEDFASVDRNGITSQLPCCSALGNLKQQFVSKSVMSIWITICTKRKLDL